MTHSAYPVRLDGRLDPALSRWKWLIKWLLVIPHFVVLVFLWIAAFVATVMAGFAILFTGHYPRAIFNFNLGVLRWTWRANYYAYSALGTDRYPPFSLAEVPDYPAHLDVPYPEHLSRGLVLVKWWLLAIPHYLIIGFFVGGGAWFATRSDSQNFSWTDGGLIGCLVLIAAIILLVTGRYPAGLYSLILGLNRWVLRVAAYTSLMTDAYPPFRLDSGGADPASPVIEVTPPTGPTA